MPEPVHPLLPVEVIQRELLEGAIDIRRILARLTRLQGWIELPDNYDAVLDATAPHTAETACVSCLEWVRAALHGASADLRYCAKLTPEEAADLD